MKERARHRKLERHTKKERSTKNDMVRCERYSETQKRMRETQKDRERHRKIERDTER